MDRYERETGEEKDHDRDQTTTSGLKGRARFLVKLFSRTVDRFSEVEGPRLGAAFSFYAIFSIFPLVLLGTTVLGFVLGDDENVRTRMIDAIASDSSIRDVVDGTLSSMQSSRSGRGLSFVIGLATLLFGASGALTELDAALNRIWEVPPPKTDGIVDSIKQFARSRGIGILLVIGIGVTTLASLVSSSVLGAIARAAPSRLTPALLQTAELALSIVLLCTVFTATFHLLPRTRPPWRDVVGGAAITTVGVTILKSVFAIYLTHLTSYSAYGIVGGVLAMATWIYLSSQIIFFGAQLTRVHCEMTGCRVEQPRTEASPAKPDEPSRTERPGGAPSRAPA